MTKKIEPISCNTCFNSDQCVGCYESHDPVTNITICDGFIPNEWKDMEYKNKKWYHVNKK